MNLHRWDTREAKMLLDEPQITQIVHLLLHKTHSDQAQWRSEGSTFYLQLPENMMISLRHEPEKEPPAGVYIVQIVSNKNDVIGELHASGSSSLFSALRTLHDRIKERVAEELFNKILASVSKEGVIGGSPITFGIKNPSVTTTTTTAAPQLHDSGPIKRKDVVEMILRRLSGDWNFHQGGVMQKVRITPTGEYLVYPELKVRFILEVLAWNSSLTTVEVAKRERGNTSSN